MKRVKPTAFPASPLLGAPTDLGAAIRAAMGFGVDLFALPRSKREAAQRRLASLATLHERRSD
jgi:hypothetical protein